MYIEILTCSVLKGLHIVNNTSQGHHTDINTIIHPLFKN
jgi:hypothetical protein